MNYSSLAASLRVWKNPVFVSIVLALACAALIPTSGRAQHFTDTLRCGKIDTVNIGQVLTLDSVTYPVSFINYFQSDTSWIVSHASPIFHIVEDRGSAFVDSIWQAHVTFTAGNTLDSISTTDTIQASGCNLNVLLKAQVIGPTKDQSVFNLQSASSQTIAFKTSDSSTFGLFYFKNNSDSSIVIDSIEIQGTSAFSITSKPSNDTTISPGNSFAVGIAYYRSSQGSDNGYLMVSVPNHPIAPFEVALQGVRTSTDAVRPQPSVSGVVLVYPNPTTGMVTINGVTGMVTVTNVLGECVMRNASSVMRDGSVTLNLSGLPAGTYFVRVETASGPVMRAVVKQ